MRSPVPPSAKLGEIKMRLREAIADRKHTEARRPMKSSPSRFSAAPIRPSIKKK
jgi:hypothetical protein